MTLHEFLDCQFGADGTEVLRKKLETGADPNAIAGTLRESPLHVATRRRRLDAVRQLLDWGAEIDALNGCGKSAFAHAVRRGFDEVADLLRERGASSALNIPDELALAVVQGRLDDARLILSMNPEAVRTGNPEEDRLLADVAGRNALEPVELLIAAGADLGAPALDDGSPLHQAAWFGQPRNARLLIDAGAQLDLFDSVHVSSPLGWAVHGGRYSGGAAERQDHYVELVRMLLAAGSSLRYPNDTGGADSKDAYFIRLLADATPRIAELLRGARGE